MKKIAVGFMAGFVFAAAIFIGSAAQAHTVAEACGECVMPEGMEEYSGYEVLVETYDTTLYDMPELAPPLAALTRRLVARQPDFTTMVLVDQIVVERGVFGYNVPGLVIGVIILGEGGVTGRYEMRLQEIVEFLYLVQYGQNRRW